MVDGVLPDIAHAEGAGNPGRMEELLNAVVAVGVAHGPLKHRPVGIAAHIPFPPIGLGQFVQSLQNLLIGGFAVHRGLRRLPGQITIHIPPVVLTEEGLLIHAVVIPCTQRGLIIAAVARLEHVEVQPRLLMEPQRGRGAPEGMVPHQLVGVELLEQLPLPAVQVMILVAPDIPAQQPDDVGPVPVALRQEGNVAVDVVHGDVAGLHHMAPGGQQGHVQPQLLGHIQHLVHKDPIFRFPGILFLLRGIGAHHFRQAMNQRCLNRRKALVTTVGQVQARLLLVTDLCQQPGGIRQIEERRVSIAQVPSVVRNPQLPLLPGLLIYHASITSFSPQSVSTAETFSTCPDFSDRPMASITAMVRMPSFRSGLGVTPSRMHRANSSR